MSELILEINKLVKDFGTFRAVDGISFTVPEGKVIGLLGPNGAGKTTTIHMLLGITSITSGKITFFGRDFEKYREYILQRINFASAYNTLQGRISAFENLKVFAYLYGQKNSEKKINNLIEYFEVEDLRDKRYWDLSAGQKTRINLIKSLLNDPELILMDEPTASLDPDIADKTLSLIESLIKERNLSVLFTSHNMSEVERICDEVIFLDHGKIVARDTPDKLKKQITSAILILTFEKPLITLNSYLQKHKIEYLAERNNRLVIKTTEKEIPRLIGELANINNIYDIEVEKPDLEDVFLQIARGENNVDIKN